MIKSNQLLIAILVLILPMFIVTACGNQDESAEGNGAQDDAAAVQTSGDQDEVLDALAYLWEQADKGFPDVAPAAEKAEITNFVKNLGMENATKKTKNVTYDVEGFKNEQLEAWLEENGTVKYKFAAKREFGSGDEAIAYYNQLTTAIPMKFTDTNFKISDRDDYTFFKLKTDKNYRKIYVKYYDGTRREGAVPRVRISVSVVPVVEE